MKQSHGYAIALDPSKVYNEYIEIELSPEDRGLLSKLQDALPFNNPKLYRGISRKLLSYADEQFEWRAYKRLVEIVGNNERDEDYDEDLMPTLEAAIEIKSLLTKPDDYEIVELARGTSDINSKELGFDIGYWGGDHFSIICDSAIMPKWHPPDPTDFKELAEALKGLNEQLLFSSIDQAIRYRDYYRSKNWAESEWDAAEFCIIRVGLP